MQNLVLSLKKKKSAIQVRGGGDGVKQPGYYGLLFWAQVQDLVLLEPRGSCGARRGCPRLQQGPVTHGGPAGRTGVLSLGKGCQLGQEVGLF